MRYNNSECDTVVEVAGCVETVVRGDSVSKLIKVQYLQVRYNNSECDTVVKVAGCVETVVGRDSVSKLIKIQYLQVRYDNSKCVTVVEVAGCVETVVGGDSDLVDGCAQSRQEVLVQRVGLPLHQHTLVTTAQQIRAWKRHRKHRNLVHTSTLSLPPLSRYEPGNDTENIVI